MNIKSGVKTTEFWLGLAAVLIGAFLASGVLPSDHWAIKLGGIAAVALASLGYSVSRGKAKGGGAAPLALACLLALSVAGCGTNVDWGKVLKVGGMVVQAGNVMTPLTCETMELLGAPAADVQRCRKAEDAAKKMADALPMVNAVAGTVINAGAVQVEGVGAVQVRAMVSESMTAPKQPPGFRLPAVPPGESHDRPPVTP